tara:strand:+ start:993 stop:2243 length:1251 start_codon:yes stop_codon:yes gene_type:complete
MNIIKKITLLFFIVSISFSNEIQLEIGTNGTLSIPLILDYNITENLSIHHTNRFYNIHHPSWRYLYQKNQRDDLTMISEISYFLFSKDNISFKIGRDYMDSNSGRINDLFFSSFSPSLNHLMFNFDNPDFQGTMSIIKLDNRSINCDNDINSYCDDLDDGKHNINRWFYYRHISWSITDKLKIGLSDAIISTGEDRGVEFYYLMPLGSFQAEQLHNISRKDFVEEGVGYGINNDNGFLGFDIDYKIDDRSSMYTSLLIDDFQIDVEDRDFMQDVFSFMAGYSSQFKNIDFIIEYSYASPWMYINSGLYTNLEYNKLSLGIRNPHSQSIDLKFDFKINEKSFTIFVHKEQIGNHTFDTDWNAWENKIDYFDFSKTLNAEVFFQYHSNKKYFPNILFYNNWKQSNNNELILTWNYIFS